MKTGEQGLAAGKDMNAEAQGLAAGKDMDAEAQGLAAGDLGAQVPAEKDMNAEAQGLAAGDLGAQGPAGKSMEEVYGLNREDRLWAEAVWEKLRIKTGLECDRIGGMIPGDVQEDGHFPDMGGQDIFWWTNGFWSGILWQMYHATGEARYMEAAKETEKKLDKALEGFGGLHHDVGFMWLPSAVADYRLTGSGESKNRGLHAANILAGRYNPKGHYIRAWNPECDPSLDTTGLVIIDCMMNLPLLYWASEVTQDSRFKWIAMEHADTVLKYGMRPDGSCCHIIGFDSDTGEYLGSLGGQGYKTGSSWSRGQSWALYGMALSFAHTGKQAYLDAAKQSAHYFIANAAVNDYVPLVDFRAPEEPVLIDTTAGVIASCGLLEIAGHVAAPEQGMYRKAAVRMLRVLVERYCDWNPRRDAILGYGTVAYHGKVHKPIIYGDYFLLEAVLRLLGKELRIW